MMQCNAIQCDFHFVVAVNFERTVITRTLKYILDVVPIRMDSDMCTFDKYGYHIDITAHYSSHPTIIDFDNRIKITVFNVVVIVRGNVFDSLVKWRRIKFDIFHFNFSPINDMTEIGVIILT